MPTRIALVTADESAAKADFLHSLEESGLPWQVTFLDSRVQGAGAELTIDAALRTADRLDVDAIALVRGGGERSNWDLSTERANATRRMLSEAGVAESRIRGVTGMADRDPLLPQQPQAAGNRRVAITLLREAEHPHQGSGR